MRSPDPNSRYVPRYEATEFPAPINTPVGSSRTEPGTLSVSSDETSVAALVGRIERLERIIREMGLDPEFHFDGTRRTKP